MSVDIAKYVDPKITTGNIINALILIVSVIVFVTSLRADMQYTSQQLDELKQYTQEHIPNTYMRRDVSNLELRLMRGQLDRIETKLDNELRQN